MARVCFAWRGAHLIGNGLLLHLGREQVRNQDRHRSPTAAVLMSLTSDPTVQTPPLENAVRRFEPKNLEISVYPVLDQLGTRTKDSRLLAFQER
jgi:hypothetical protein